MRLLHCIAILFLVALIDCGVVLKVENCTNEKQVMITTTLFGLKKEIHFSPRFQ